MKSLQNSESDRSECDSVSVDRDSEGGNENDKDFDSLFTYKRS